MSSFAGNSRHRAGPLATAIVCVSQFMVILDVTIVVIALPAIREGLEFSDADLQWVFTAYTLVFGGLLICGGRLADVAGRRRIFLIGLGRSGSEYVFQTCLPVPPSTATMLP